MSSTSLSSVNMGASSVKTPYNGITVKLLYLNPRSLKPHEKFIETRVLEVEGSIVKTKCLMRPLIVDENTLTVIDGTHRLEALRRLNVSKTPVLLVDYLREEEIKVDRWIRVYRGRSDVLEELLKLLRSRIPGGIVRRGETLVYKVWEVGDPAKIYWILEDIESYVKGVTLNFRDRMPKKPGKALILLPPRLGKGDVIRAAVESKLFPPKTTRHVTMLKKVILRTRLSDLVQPS